MITDVYGHCRMNERLLQFTRWLNESLFVKHHSIWLVYISVNDGTHVLTHHTRLQLYTHLSSSPKQEFHCFFFVLFFFSSNDLFYFVCYLYSYFRLHQRRRRRKGCMQAHRCLPHQLRRYLQHHWLSLDTGPAEGSWVEFSLHTLSLSLTAWRLFLCLTGFTQMEDFVTT